MNSKERVMEEFKEDIARIPEYQEPPVAGAAHCSAFRPRSTRETVESAVARSKEHTRRFCCSYDHDDATWAVNIDAYDWADAEARVAKLGYLRLDGELIATVRCGWMARLACWVRNAVTPNEQADLPTPGK